MSTEPFRCACTTSELCDGHLRDYAEKWAADGWTEKDLLALTTGRPQSLVVRPGDDLPLDIPILASALGQIAHSKADALHPIQENVNRALIWYSVLSDVVDRGTFLKLVPTYIWWDVDLPSLQRYLGLQRRPERIPEGMHVFLWQYWPDLITEWPSQDSLIAAAREALVGELKAIEENPSINDTLIGWELSMPGGYISRGDAREYIGLNVGFQQARRWASNGWSRKPDLLRQWTTDTDLTINEIIRWTNRLQQARLPGTPTQYLEAVHLAGGSEEAALLIEVVSHFTTVDLRGSDTEEVLERLGVMATEYGVTIEDLSSGVNQLLDIDDGPIEVGVLYGDSWVVAVDTLVKTAAMIGRLRIEDPDLSRWLSVGLSVEMASSGGHGDMERFGLIEEDASGITVVVMDPYAILKEAVEPIIEAGVPLDAAEAWYGTLKDRRQMGQRR